MTVVAIIPARGDSKRLERKNLLPLAGRPLVAHTILHALGASQVDEVYVSTEDPEIAEVARAHGADVVERPADLAGDEATSESALLHALDERSRRGLGDPDLVVFLQCTSAVRRPGDVDGAIETLVAGGFDSVFSASPTYDHLWAAGPDGPRSLNYDFRAREREQERRPQYVENGSIYAFRPWVLREQGNRLGGRIGIFEMDPWTSFQIDGPDDVELVEWILRRPEYRPPVAWPDRVELVVFDFDGVMTDNTVLVGEGGAESVVCNRGDGWGIGMLRRAGVPMLVLSTEPHPVVSARAAKLELPCLQGLEDKAAALAEALGERGVDPEHVVYVGNDLNDLGCFELAGFPVAVADAHPRLLALAKLVLTRPGGRGAVRELCELLLARLGAPAERG